MILIYFLFLIENSDCLLCHEDVKILERIHGSLKCINCHKGIKELPHSVPLTKVNCGDCHKNVMESFKGDPHQRARIKGNLKAPDCKDCHGTHLILHPLNLDIFCATCHINIKAPPKYHITFRSSSECLSCHGDKTKNVPFVDIKVLKESAHRRHECMDCHREVISLTPSKEGHVKDIECKDCGICHKREFEQHRNSIHGEGLEIGMRAAKCFDCHGTHDIFAASDKRSYVYFQNLPKTCAKCHSDPKFAEKYGIPVKNPWEMYEQSIHYAALKEGKRGANCSDCHGVHEIQPHTSFLSTINKGNIPKTCGKCHKKEYEDFAKSEHFESFKMGVRDAPVCTDCHVEHRILPPWDPGSPVYPSNVPKTCADCHESIKLTQRYGLPAMEISRFMSTYHGIAIKAGNIFAANCASCHEHHKILPSSNPESSIHKDNLPKTCGKCHPAVRKGGKVGPVHARIDKTVKTVQKIVSIIYTLIILITISGMIIYCFLDYLKKTREFHEKGIREFKPEKVKNTKFSKTERTLHLVHLISFFLLVYTGFAHRYPENILFNFFVKIQNGVLRSYLHRIAGTSMLIAFLTMVFLMVFTRKGREKFKALIPNFKDLSDSINLFLYNIGIKKERPILGHPFTFYEKFEFWALIWGTIIMGITGIFLWFRDFSLTIFQSWILDIFLLIHFYEAMLATLAIIVWHFYFAIFDPEVYPLNPLMFKDEVFSHYVKIHH